MKTNTFNLEQSSIDEVLSKLINYNLVSNEKTSAGLDSFRMLIKELLDDQIYFGISDSDKNSSEQLTDDSEGIADSSQVHAVPPINTSILHISTEFVTDVVACGSISKENNLIPLLNTDTHTPQFSDNSTIP